MTITAFDNSKSTLSDHLQISKCSKGRAGPESHWQSLTCTTTIAMKGAATTAKIIA